MSKDKKVYYRTDNNLEVVIVNYTKLHYERYRKDFYEKYPMGSATDRTETYLLYIGMIKSTEKKIDEILESFKKDEIISDKKLES